MLVTTLHHVSYSPAYLVLVVISHSILQLIVIHSNAGIWNLWSITIPDSGGGAWEHGWLLGQAWASPTLVVKTENIVFIYLIYIIMCMYICIYVLYVRIPYTVEPLYSGHHWEPTFCFIARYPQLRDFQYISGRYCIIGLLSTTFSELSLVICWRGRSSRG